MMKRYIIIGLMLCVNVLMQAQELIVGTTQVVCDTEVPVIVNTQLKTRLRQLLAKEGVTIDSELADFVIVPTISIDLDQRSNGIPAYQEVAYTLQFALCQLSDGKCFATYDTHLSGKGSSTENAIATSLRQLKIDDREFLPFVARVKSEIIQYYETRCSKMLYEAQTQMRIKDYEGAIATLSAIPDVVPSYGKVQHLLREAYVAHDKQQQESYYQKGLQAWMSEQTNSGAEAAMEYLSLISTSSPAYAKAQALVKSMNERLKKDDERQWALKSQVIQSALATRKAEIEAYRAIAVARAQNQPKVIRNTRWVLMR